MDKLKNILKMLSFLALIFLGALMFVYGEYDDSPGGQLLGLIVIIFGIVAMIKLKKCLVK